MFKLKSAWNIAVGDEIRIPGWEDHYEDISY
ncbi:hypothetical protein rv5_gp197 [Escherichia phage V5]|uniref:Uncharacterized protein n=1 Tax=Escherichia phage V5 TaxID=399183 RepID=B3RGY6_9CAUD|nr:hypothetical protein rv5_gp197 [Escherichia phage V5]ABI79267.1 hypothetical protein [Escherichia phage V5]